MSLPTIEVVWKEATEAFRANPKDRSLVKESFDILSAQQGQLQYVLYGTIPDDQL